MKETFYTPSNLAQQARAFLDDVPFARRLAAGAQPDSRSRMGLQPAQAALLVLDMQAYFLDPQSHAFVPSAPALVQGLRQLVDAFRAADQPVIFTRHANTPQDAGSMAGWWSELMLPDHPLGDVIPELAPEAVLLKSQYDAFLGTDLADNLQRQGVRQVVIGGVMTHLCCESTARGAFMRGFEVFFLVDGCAAYTAAHQRASLLNLAHGFAALCLASEVQQALEVVHG
jgi:isochorismate hydrolase